MPEPQVSEEVVAEVTAAINEALGQFGRLPPKQRDAAVMTTIMVLAEKLLVNSSHDPHVGFLMLMSGLTDVYHSAFGNPNRTVQ